MASPAQQTVMRRYSYGYSGKSGYHRLLKTAHSTLVNNLMLKKDKEGAETLQNFLQDIKNTARYLNEQTESFLKHGGVPTMEELALSQVDLEQWYKNFIDEVTLKETNKRQLEGLSPLKGETLFRREHSTQRIKATDDILEEEFAAVLAALQEKFGGTKTEVGNFVSGQGLVTVQGLSALEKVYDSVYETFIDEFKKLAPIEENHSFALSSHLTAERTGKADINAGTFQVDTTIKVDNDFLNNVIALLNEATFTIKNYKTSPTFERPLELGKTNLLKAITAELNVVFPQNAINDQRDIFYRGSQIMVKTVKPPSATKAEVMQHYTHMRFIYELSGMGLINSDGTPHFAKYLIYNVPNSTEIYVTDTASIILNEINNKRARSNVFGVMYLGTNKARG